MIDLHAKHILFITSSRIGDAVLSFGILDTLTKRYPNAHFTLVCGPLVKTLLEGFPLPHKIITLKKQKYNKHWLDLWHQVIGIRFDVVVDLRNSLVSRTIMARRRYIFGPRIDQSQHKVEQNAAVLGIHPPPDPVLWLSLTQTTKALSLMPDGERILGVGPTANWLGKTWPVDRFVEIVAWLTGRGGFMEDARVAVFAAPGEEETARTLLASIPSARAIDLIAKTDPGTAAACLSRCAYYLGNDSGLMHCAAAAGIPTLGLFGPSYPHLYKPWGKRAAYISTPETFDQLIDFDGYNPKTVGTLMKSLAVDAVKEVLTSFFEREKA